MKGFAGLPFPKSLLIKWTRRNKQKYKLWKLLSSNRDRKKIIRANSIIADKFNWDHNAFVINALKHRALLRVRAEVAYEEHGCPLGIM